jgi:hypothetical protein
MPSQRIIGVSYVGGPYANPRVEPVRDHSTDHVSPSGLRLQPLVVPAFGSERAIPPSEAGADQLTVEFFAIGKQNRADAAAIAIMIQDVDPNRFSKCQIGSELTGLGTEGLAFFRAVDARQSDCL